ncbi:non-ribosomal peptide synthetase [Colletotrichum plurivorum]|uniref:Non-ribosomal peptide synthetase n=1 Tax=Colletotrichum plurivorum TaxID=2175906 RepID=A0A8H6NBK3_9PEZI|nr:non-ribosomal peptide synthetase [Colletotrichum plurivorum]
MTVNQNLRLAYQNTAETLFFHQSQLVKLQQQASCSGASIIRLACSIALQAYSSTESVTLSFKHEGSNGAWNSWTPKLERHSRVLAHLMESEDHSSQTEKHGTPQYALRLFSLEDGAPPSSQPTSLLLLKKDFPDLNLLFTAKFDAFSQGILLGCEYSQQSEWQARRILSTFRQVLEDIVLKPYSQIGELELLSAADLRQCSDGNRSLPSQVDTFVHHMIATHAQATPSRPAVDSWDGSLSYAELDEASTKVASELQNCGVGPESAVALLFEKSMWNVVATLAVLKAGGAFVPLDASMPDARISYILQKAQTKAVLTSWSFGDRLRELSGSVLTLGDTWLQSTPTPTSWNPTPVCPWNLAYIMFTSGSTGEPKGVMIDHSACASSVVAHGKATGFNGSTRAIQYARHTFDASIAEILTTLCFGGCVIVPSEDQRMNNITAVLQEKEVNWAFFTPSVARLLDPAELPGMKTVVLGGEAVGRDSIEQWAPGRSLVNGYGPTENTVFSVMCSLALDAKAHEIGRGVGTTCWIADPEDPHRLMPLGATGELLLEGPQLARGYLGFGENEGPNKAFIRDPPWLSKLGRRARLYRTGDLCRFDANGVLHYQGRKDTQLKISGQRLEASEVEHHLRSAFGTSDVIVDVLPRPTDGPNPKSKVLVAFVCLERSTEKTPVDESFIMPYQNSELQQIVPGVEARVSEVLPSWMCPSVYVPLSNFPLSPNGKADVKRLRQEFAGLSHDSLYSDCEAGESTHSGESEQVKLMRELWAEVLGTPLNAVMENSNFFRLGGDSLAAMALVVASRKRGLQLDVAQIFRNPVLHDLCQLPTVRQEIAITSQPFELLTDRSRTLTEVAEEHSISIEDIEDCFPCTPLQEGLMALSSTTANSFLVQYVLDLAVGVDVRRLKTAWEMVAKTHGILRTRLINDSASGILQAVVREDLAWCESFERDDYLAADLKMPSGFGSPLNRYGIIYDESGTAFQMVWTVHHAIVDGHSAGLTLTAVRDAFLQSLQSASSSFSSFIKYSMGTWTGDESARQFWASTLESLESEPFPKKPTAVNLSSKNQVSPYVDRQISLPSSSPGVTAATILRAAWGLVIARFSGSRDAVFGVTSSGRNSPFESIESVIGPIIATVPLRVRFGNDTTVRGLLEGLQTTTINMIPFEQIGVQNIGRINTACRTACEFQSIMVVQPEVDMAIDGTPFTALQRPQELGEFNSHAIMIECNLKKNSVNLTAHYDTAFLDRRQMTRLVDYFEMAVDFLATSEDQLVEAFGNQPTTNDINQIQGWNNERPETVDSCVHQLFEEQASSQPDAQAVFAWDGCLSFSELDRNASQLARVLFDLGIGREKKVAYCFEKSLYTVVSMLAILKAGGTMVPLDPAHPRDRKSFILQSITAEVVLTSAQNAEMFSGMDVQVVVVGPDLFVRLNDIQAAPFSSRGVQPQNAATVLFTSGSTGTPKGVIQEHRTLCSAAIAHSDGMQMAKGSRILQFSSHVFDVSIIEIVNSLVLGACLCIPSEEDRLSNLAAFVSRSQADWAFFTPSFARTLDPKDLPSLKTVVMGGEAMTPDIIQKWAGHVQLINGYGPCEGSVCTVANFTEGRFKPDSIGRGLNCLIWIVAPENHDRLLPIGCPGEILLEGPSVARGYLSDEERTGTSFITNPAWTSSFDAAGGLRRMYKTGDLGSLNSDGSISYLGRKDGQIKLRGQRIEPGEVEHQLLKLLPAGSAVAVDALSVSSSKLLAAFIQLATDENCDLSEQNVILGGLANQLKLQMSTVLPGYMVPSKFFAVESFPFGPTGKLDRKRLREHALTVFNMEAPSIKTDDEFNNVSRLRSDEEVALVLSNKLADLLSRDDDSAESLRGHNFNPYHAGMDSIQVISLSTFVRKTYNVSLPIKKYMNSAITIRDIAQWIIDDQHVSHNDDGIDLLLDIEKHDEPLAGLSLPQATAVLMDTPQVVFLTGATGFLGNQLLAQLLQRADTPRVVALVRGQDRVHATERLLSLARGSTWWQEEYAERLEVWHGDLAQPRLGLSDAEWSRLDGSRGDGDLVDAIIHNGAVVNWMADYQALTAANILSTVHLLTATTKATATRPVRFTYVSGGHLSTSPDVTQQIAQELKTYPAYSQTKFVAEILVARYAERLSQAGYGPLVSIVKPGLIMGSSADGVSNTDDFLWRVTASALEVGVYCGDEGDLWLAAAGVDLVAQIVLQSCFSRDADAPYRTVRKVLNGVSMREYWNVVIEETGKTMAPTDTEVWLRALRDKIEERGSTHKLWPVMHFLEDKQGKLGQDLGSMSIEDQVKHQTDVRKALRKSLQYLVAIGYMDSGRTGSDDGDSGSEPNLLSPGLVVFSRTPTTPIWDFSGGSKSLDNTVDGAKAISVAMAALRSPSPASEVMDVE